VAVQDFVVLLADWQDDNSLESILQTVPVYFLGPDVDFERVKPPLEKDDYFVCTNMYNPKRQRVLALPKEVLDRHPAKPPMNSTASGEGGGAGSAAGRRPSGMAKASSNGDAPSAAVEPAGVNASTDSGSLPGPKLTQGTSSSVAPNPATVSRQPSTSSAATNPRAVVTAPQATNSSSSSATNANARVSAPLPSRGKHITHDNRAFSNIHSIVLPSVSGTGAPIAASSHGPHRPTVISSAALHPVHSTYAAAARQTLVTPLAPPVVVTTKAASLHNAATYERFKANHSVEYVHENTTNVKPPREDEVKRPRPASKKNGIIAYDGSEPLRYDILGHLSWPQLKMHARTHGEGSTTRTCARFPGYQAEVPTETAGALRTLEQSVKWSRAACPLNAAELEGFLRTAKYLATSFCTGMRVGAPHPRRMRIWPAVLLNWTPALRTESGILHWAAPAAADSTSDHAAQQLLPPGCARICFIDYEMPITVHVDSLHTNYPQQLVSTEDCLAILHQYNFDTSASLSRIAARAKSLFISHENAAGKDTASMPQVISVQQAIRALSGKAELAALPRTSMDSNLVSAVHQSELPLWSEEQQRQFSKGLNRFSKNFHQVAQVVTSKTTKDCVDFYYRNKHFRMLLTGIGDRSLNPTQRPSNRNQKHLVTIAGLHTADLKSDAKSAAKPEEEDRVDRDSDEAEASEDGATEERRTSKRMMQREVAFSRSFLHTELAQLDAALAVVDSAADPKAPTAFCSAAIANAAAQGQARWCNVCGKCQTHVMVCCIPACAQTMCESCFRSKLRAATPAKVQHVIHPHWKLSRNNSWWMCFDCCPPCPSGKEVAIIKKWTDSLLLMHTGVDVQTAAHAATVVAPVAAPRPRPHPAPSAVRAQAVAGAKRPRPDMMGMGRPRYDLGNVQLQAPVPVPVAHRMYYQPQYYTSSMYGHRHSDDVNVYMHEHDPHPPLAIYVSSERAHPPEGSAEQVEQALDYIRR
jgi:hypothetical protein